VVFIAKTPLITVFTFVTILEDRRREVKGYLESKQANDIKNKYTIKKMQNLSIKGCIFS